MKHSLAVALILLLVAGPARAASRDVIRTDWSGFEREVLARKLTHRTAQITLATGDESKTKLLSVSDRGLVVRATRATQQWASGNKEANIPKEQIRSVRFEGRLGHRGLIGALAGLGAG